MQSQAFNREVASLCLKSNLVIFESQQQSE
jgi:hypothetical protein